MKRIMFLVLLFCSLSTQAITFNDYRYVLVDGVNMFESCATEALCGVAVEKDDYAVVTTQYGRDCGSGGVFIVNIKSNRGYLIDLDNCTYDPDTNLTEIMEGILVIYEGNTESSSPKVMMLLPD